MNILARLEAIETIMIGDVSGAAYNAGLTATTLEPLHARLVQRFAERTFPGEDPAMADHYADEVKVHIERITQLVRKNLADAGRP